MDCSLYSCKKKATVYCVAKKTEPIIITGPPGPQGEPGPTATIYGGISYITEKKIDFGFINTQNLTFDVGEIVPFYMTNTTPYYIDEVVNAKLEKTNITYNGNPIFGLKYVNTNDLTPKKVRVYASYDANSSTSNVDLAIYIGKVKSGISTIPVINYFDIENNYSGAYDKIYIKPTECGASTGSSNGIAKLVSSWIVEIEPNESIILGITRFNKNGSTTVSIIRGRIVISEL